MRINLHIKRLVLDGFKAGPKEQVRLKSACEAHLTQLLIQGGIAPGVSGGADGTCAQGAPISAINAVETPLLGRQIAQAVYERIKP